jgi:hypothetical protein
MILEEDYIYRTSDTLALILMLIVVYTNMILFNYWRRSDDLVMWYQPYTILLILGELVGFSLLMIFLMHWFIIELRFAAAFFSILVTLLSFELFTDSLRPLIVGIFRRRELNKNMAETKKKNLNSENENIDDSVSKDSSLSDKNDINENENEKDLDA